MSNRRLLPWLFFLSGAGSLAVEAALTRLLADVLGGAAPAAAAVSTAWLGGLALGAFWGAPVRNARARRSPPDASTKARDGARRGGSRAPSASGPSPGGPAIAARSAALPPPTPPSRGPGGSAPAGAGQAGSPLLVFAALELPAAVWAILFPLLVPALRALAASGGAGLAVRALLAAAVLLPAAVLGGATLSACARRLPEWDAAVTAGRLYGCNAAGAALGAAVSGLVLIPAIGLWGACATGAGLQLAAALAAALVSGFSSAPALPPTPALAPETPDRAALLAAFLAGAAGLSAEILWIRLLLPRLGGTARALAYLLAADLLGLAVGALIPRKGSPRGYASVALAVAALFIAAGGWLWLSVLDSQGGGRPPGMAVQLALLLLDAGRPRTSHGAGALVLFWILPTAVVFGAATPALFVHHAKGRVPGRAVGEVAAASGAGSALGAIAAPFLLVPAFGARGSLLAAAALALAGAATVATGRARAMVAALGLAATVAAVALPFHAVPPPGRILVARAEDPLSEAWTVEEPVEHARGLLVNGDLREGGTALEARAAEALQAHVPLLLHPAPRRVLWLGVGSGVSLAAAATHAPERLDAVELLPAVLSLLPSFFPWSRQAMSARLVADDARGYLLASHDRWDVIVAELFYPWEAGAGGLYSVEQFRAARRHLAPGGLFCQWLPLYLLPPPALAVVAASLRAAFPHGAAVAGLTAAGQPQIAFCGAKEPIAPPVPGNPAVEARVAALADGGALSRLWGRPSDALASLWLFGDDGLAALAAGAPLETDLRPRIEWLCARSRAHLRDSWTQDLERVRSLAHPLGPAAGARRAIFGEALALGRDDLDEALRFQRRAEAEAPWLGESALAGLRLEGPLRHAGDYEDAEALLSRAARMLDPDAATLFMLGTLRLRAGDAPAAVARLSEALALDPRCARCSDLLAVARREVGMGR